MDIIIDKFLVESWRIYWYCPMQSIKIYSFNKHTLQSAVWVVVVVVASASYVLYFMKKKNIVEIIELCNNSDENYRISPIIAKNNYYFNSPPSDRTNDNNLWY